jgi:hypothetical protein
MSTQEAVTKIKSLKREFNRLRKYEGRADDESLLFWYNRKLDTAIAAIASDDVSEAKSVLTKLKADFDGRAKSMQETREKIEIMAPLDRVSIDHYDHVTEVQKRFQSYSNKVKEVLAVL